MKAYMYILKCVDGSYYTGSTKDLDIRLAQHQNGEGSNYTKDRLPVELVYYEEFQRIDDAFYREKQVQRWSRKKKEALINSTPELLPSLSMNRKKQVAEPIVVAELVEATLGPVAEPVEATPPVTSTGSGTLKSVTSTGSGTLKSVPSTGSGTLKSVPSTGSGTLKPVPSTGSGTGVTKHNKS